MKYIKKTFLFLFLFFSAIIVAQELPPIEVYSPDAYGGETQNWSISQADNKYIYVANNKGLLEFNGANWELYPTPNETVMRSVKVVGQRIYTGFYMNFGYWKKNNFGKLEYTSLSSVIKDKLIEDEQFWHIVNQGDWVLFQSLNRIYLYNITTEEISIIESKLTLTNIFNVNGTIYYQDLNNGVYKIEKGLPILVIDVPEVINDKIVNIWKSNNKILVLTTSKGFFELSNGEVSKWNTESDALLNEATVYSSITLRDGSIVLGTISNGFIYLSDKGEIIYRINQNQGLNNNTVLSSFEDIDGNIWLALDNGINCLNLKSPIQSFNDDKGTIGTVYATIVFNDFLYLGTNQGLFYKKLDKDEQFKFVEGTNGQVWNLFSYDNTLFCGHDSGTFQINQDSSQLICSIGGTWIFRVVPGHPDWLLQGHYGGLSILEKENGTWGLRQKIEGFDYSARFLEIYEDKLWINHEYKGLFSLTLDDDFSKVLEIVKDTIISKGKNSSIARYKNNIFYAHQRGVFSYNKEKKKFEENNLISQTFDVEKKGIGKLVKDNRGGLWNFAEDELDYIFQSQFSDNLDIIKVPIPYILRKEMIGFENILHVEEDKYLLGTTYGYMILDLSRVHSREYNIILEKVSAKQKSTTFEEIDFLDTSPVFESNLNTVSFEYAIPEYDKYLISKFQYKLDGFYEDWSSWTTKTNIIFENLPFGDYTFKVRAKIGNDLSDNVLRYKFTIDRPWYFSFLAIVIYSVLFLILLLIMHRTYKRYYSKQREKLVEENKKQLELKELESEREIMKLNNEKLTQDIDSKNRELASSTMNIIKKNEILNTIKKELQKSESEPSGLKNVERIIDRNLNNKDDWNHFVEAFNSVDKDFLKKLKAKHDNLTPHDLRFCTYLRLNLSSKEIAPLLNISVRSVEIKRYRLRKKLELEHSDSLVNYILEI
ncbi:Y_Y_Y domain-containing protein [Aquimarina amphilecti]|uniref:Y_Y_Y domain-containing protein n=1 Tax=Aquimarina amphilecti TaxID=1038014 RepID=A0A1H7FRX6_AQUAM|nr:triple tyrosine motif-containing protein [Aquimarina amphilecti]SEK26115.1 Y_Y_Y domain-containing protein [Aquimarina amphilecti]